MPGGTRSVAITRYTPLYVCALALPGRLSRLWFLPAPPHRVGGLGLTCAKAAKFKACAILVSKLHKSCFLILTYARGRFYIVPTMPGLCIWAKSPTAQKSAHVWKRGLVRFNRGGVPH